MSNNNIADKDIRADVEVCRIIEKHVRHTAYIPYTRGGERCSMYDWIGFKLLGLRVALPIDGAVMRIAYWDDARKARYVMKVGKFVAKFFKDSCSLTDHGVQTVGSSICAELWAGNDGGGVTLYRGDDIKKQYLALDVVYSCMSHTYTNEYLNLYCENPDKVQLAVVDGGLGQLRALVWTCRTKEDEEVRFISTSYYSANAAEAVLTQWAASEGIIYRAGGCNTTPALEVVLKYDIDAKWPYVDHLYSVTNNGDGTVTLSNRNGIYEAHSTEGFLQGYSDEEEGHQCENCGEWASDEYARTDPDGNWLCDSCYCDLVSYCENCDTEVWASQMVSVRHDSFWDVCERCAYCNFSRCPDCGEWVLNECVTETGTGAVVCLTCFEEGYSICQICEEVMKNDDGGCVHNGDWLCDTCLEETHFECTECGEYFSNETGKGDMLCTDCAMEKMEALCNSTTED